MEETETSKTKASDSAYSNSSTSQYQRSNGSSKSRHSNSSGSSVYCGHPSILSSGNDEGFSQPQTCAKRKEKKRKQHKVMECLSSSSFWEQEGRGEEGNDSGMPAGLTVVNGSSSTGTPPSGINVIGGAASASEVTPIKKSTTAEVGNGNDSEVLQMAALTQTLHCIKKMKAKDSTLKCLQGENGSPRNGSGPLDSRVKEHLASCFSKDSCSPQDEGESFVVVVSMADGTVVHTSRNLTTSLGFPSDMWLGRDFIDFVHPKDRMAFAGHITSGVARGEDSTCKGLPPKTSFYCSLRQYRGLRNVGYGVTRKQVPYLPFCLTLTFREMNAAAMGSKATNPMEESSSAPNLLETKLQHQGKTGELGTEEMNGSVFIVIAATRIYSAYQVPNEEIVPAVSRKTPPPLSPSQPQAQKPLSLYTTSVHPPVVMGKFVTRHLSSCHLSHIDPAAVPYLGYLPQDMEARSVMDFYHPEDMPILKEAYQNVMSQQSSPFKGKPYRFRTQNGTYILVETEWSSFVNPWSRKLEFVIGQHHVLKGPSNPDVFAEPKEENCPQFSDEVLKEGESIQKEIILMLDQKVTRVSESARQQVSKRCRDLASFMESLMDEMAKPVDPLRVELPAHDDQCFSERDSVMLGEISPHHDFYDGKSSTETPPSYNQLNYNENLQRFFESKPKTASSDESGEMKLAGSSSNNRSPLSTDEEGKSFPMALDSSSASGGERKWCSRANESESGGSGSRARPGVVGGDSCHDDHDPGGGGGDKNAVEGMSKCKGKRGGGNLEVTPKGSRVLSSHEKGRTLNNCCTGSFHSPHLTEALLNRHNEDMEKQMVQKHREQRSLDREGKVKDGRKSNVEKVQDPLISHGVKRSVSHSWEGEPQRVKHQHIEQQGNQEGVAACQQLWEQQHQLTACTKAVPLTTSSSVQNNPNPTINANAASSSAPRNGKIVQSGLRVQPVQLPSSPSLNLWPPFSVTLTPLNNTQPCLSYSCPGMTHQQHPIPNLPMSGPPPSSAQIQQQPTAAPMELPPQQCPPSLRYPPPAAPVHHAAFSHSLNPHQGFIPVFYVPTGPGIMSTSVDAGNSSTQSRLLGYSHQQVQQQQMPSFPYLVPTHHSQATGLPSMAGTSYIPNHLQYINTFPQMVYQSVSHAQATGPGVQQAYVSSVNNLMAGTAAPPSTHLSAPIVNPSPPSPLPPRSLSSAQNPQFTRIRRSARSHQSGHLLHHVRLQQPPAVAVKSLSRQGNFLRGRDGLGVVLLTERDALSSNAVPEKTLQKEERDESRSPLIFSKCQRPSSQATSVKAEPGSAVGSVASASRLRELLEVSKKCKSIGSSGFSRTNTVMEEEEDFEGRDGKEMTSHDRKNHNAVQEFSLLQDRDTLCDDSSYSSLYSFLRTEKSDESMQSFSWDSRGDCSGNNQKHCGAKGKGGGAYAEKNGLKPARKGPSWMEEVDVTPDLILRYKMDDQILSNVLEADLKALKTISQSSTVNEQLSQLYMDMELEGATTKLSLEDSTGFTSSSGTDEASGAYNNISASPTPSKMSHKLKKKRRSLDYGKLVMIFEENAPFPPPSVPTCSQ